MNSDLIKKIIEGALLAAGKPLDIARLEGLFEDEERPPRDQIGAALEEIEAECRDRGFELMQTASGYRFQVRQELSTWINRLWTEKPKRYSRAMLETLALIAYRQPLTRGDIEQVRGVAVSSDTTKTFLDYFNIKSLQQLPALSEIKDFSELDPELELALTNGMDKEALARVAANDEITVSDDLAPEHFSLQSESDGDDASDTLDNDDLQSSTNHE